MLEKNWRFASRPIMLRTDKSIVFASLTASKRVHMRFPMANRRSWEWQSTSCVMVLLVPSQTSIWLLNIYVVKRRLLDNGVLPFLINLKILNVQHVIHIQSCHPDWNGFAWQCPIGHVIIWILNLTWGYDPHQIFLYHQHGLQWLGTKIVFHHRFLVWSQGKTHVPPLSFSWIWIRWKPLEVSDILLRLWWRLL